MLSVRPEGIEGEGEGVEKVAVDDEHGSSFNVVEHRTSSHQVSWKKVFTHLQLNPFHLRTA